MSLQEKLVKIKLSDIESNPHRDLKFNPLNPEKLAALVDSIHQTGFWSNVIVRPHPEKQGKYQLSYGHHRLQSAINAGLTEAEFVVRDLDEGMLLRMMELENSESYRYCPLSLLESCKAVVNALAAGRIAPFKHAPNMNEYRIAPKFTPVKSAESKVESAMQYTVLDVARYLGRTKVKDTQSDSRVNAALDALYLLEVKAITTASIKEMNWSQLGRFVADAKAERERTILRKVKTAEEIKELNAKALQIQADQKAKEKKIADERAALVKKEADAKREDDAKKAKAIKERIIEKDVQAEKIAETFEVKKAVIEAKVEEVKQKQVAAKQEDVYLPIRRESDRIVHLLERREEEEEIKALSRRALNANDRERLRQAAIAKGTWLMDWVAQQFLPPLSVKNNMAEYRRREEAKRRAEKKEETK